MSDFLDSLFPKLAKSLLNNRKVLEIIPQPIQPALYKQQMLVYQGSFGGEVSFFAFPVQETI